MKPAAASRVKSLPPYLFAELDRIKAELGSSILDLAEGNPDIPPPPALVRAFIQALKKPENHRYPTYAGKITFRAAVARWYKRRFGVALNPEDEVLALLGSKEGAAHLIWALAETNDTVGVCDPGYPMYLNAVRLSGATPVIIPLEEKNHFLPDPDFIARIAHRLKLLCLNFPNNPTAACATLDLYRALVALALKYGFYILNDNVYSELYYTTPPPSILEIPDAKACALELHSLSKTFSIPGWRIGCCVGNPDLLAALLKIKQNVDSGPFGAIQDAAAFALTKATAAVRRVREIYRRRRDVFCAELREGGWPVTPPEATFYIWARLPDWWREKSLGSLSYGFALALLKECRICAAPGSGFGSSGEGYVRFALIADENALRRAGKRMCRWLSRCAAAVQKQKTSQVPLEICR